MNDKVTNNFKFINKSKATIIAKKGWIARNAYQRMRGLLGYNKLEDGQGLFLRPGSCIHMRGMKFPLDIIFVDRKLNVVKIVENLPPDPKWKIWKMTCGGWKSHSCIELPIGTIAKTETKVGDVIRFEPMTTNNQ